jgi:hypothetical protein
MANGPDYWSGQTKINGKLCRVDWLIVQALREISSLLGQSGGDVSRLNELINQTDALSAEVALERPPGCSPEDRTSGLR